MFALLNGLLLLSLVLSDNTCTSEQVYVKFTKQTKYSATQESWEIYDPSGTKIYTSPRLQNNALRVLEECLPATANNQYTLKLKDTSSSWSDLAYFMIEGPYGNRILKHLMVVNREETLPLSLYTPVLKNDQWKLKSGSVTGTWYEFSFPDSGWDLVTLGSVTIPVSGHQYFRKTFTGLASMAAYELSMNYRYGIVAYMNGVEVYRDNMPVGTITPATMAIGSYSTVEYHAIIRPGAEVTNSQSIVAVEVHFLTAEGQSNVDFDAYLALYASTVADDSCYIYSYDTTFTASAGSNVANMMDFSRSSYYSASSSQVPATITMAFNGPTPYLNGVRVWPYTYPTYAPATYNLQATNSATGDWTNVVVAQDLIYTSSTYLTSKGYFNSGLYTNYRFELVSAYSSSLRAYEMYPLVCNVPVPTVIEFAQQHYTYYAKYENVLVKPKLGEITGCTITPTPTDLEFDSATCTLSGKVMTTSTTSYTMSATINGHAVSGTFTLQVVDCAGTVITAHRTYSSNAAYEGFTIKDQSNNVVLEVTANSGQINDREQKYIVCVTGTKYIASVYSSSYDYWSTTSFLYINGMLDGENDYETILRAKYDVNLGLPTDYTFNAQYAIKSFESWNYKMGDVPTNWYSDPSSWQSASAGNFPASSNQIQLYKKTFSVSSLDGVAGFVISLKYQYGVQIYVNNHEVFRKGFTGELSTTTMASTSLVDANFRQISLPVKTMTNDTATPAVEYLTTGQNTIAIALIASNAAMTTSTFDCAVRLMGVSSISRIWKTTDTDSYVNGNAVTNFYYGYTIYYSSCHDNWYQITFDDDRHEWVSSVVFKLHYQQNTQQPHNVIIQAKNAEDSTWTEIKTVTGMSWSLMGQSNRIWLNNNKAYNQYRFQNFATGSTTDCYWKLGQIDLRSDDTRVTVPALSYTSSIQIFKDIEMGEVYPSSTYYTDFTVNPPLPTGVTLDPYTGTISGTAHEATTQTYTVTAKKYNTGEIATTMFSMSVEVCTGGRSLITMVARTDSYPEQASYRVYQGKDTSGTVMYSIDAFTMVSNLNYGDFCLNHGIYTLELKDTYGGWSNPAGYYLTVDVGEMKFEMGYVTATSPASVTTLFSSYLPFQIEYDDWKVYKDSAVADGWNGKDFDDSTWTVTKAANIGTTEAVTVYLRRDITLDDASNYQVLNVRVKYAGGIVCYFNGRRVARFNLEDNFDADTESIEVHDSTVFSKFHIVLPTVGAVTGKNVIAFEVHRPYGQSSSEAVVFDATGVFGVNDCSIGVDSIIDVSGTTGYTIGSLENFFDLTPVTYGYQSNNVNTYLQWTVENLEGTKFNSYALQTVYRRTGWGFTLYGRENAYADDDPQAEEYVSMFSEVDLATVAMNRVAWDVPVGIAGFRQFRHDIDDTASSSVYISAYIFQYCKAQGEGFCEAVGDFPAVAEGQISPADCDEGFRGYAYRVCQGGQLGAIQTDKCIYKIPARMNYDQERYAVVMNTQTKIAAPTYLNVITKFYLETNTFLPAGLELDEATGAITGKATEESELKKYTIYGENPTGITSTTVSISVRKGECKADGNFQKTFVGEVATYECSQGGSYVGTQERACILGVKDGEWQKIQGTCMPVSLIVILILIVIIIIAVVVFFVMRATKKTKAVGGVKGKKSTKSGKTPKKADKKPSTKAVKV